MGRLSCHLCFAVVPLEKLQKESDRRPCRLYVAAEIMLPAPSPRPVSATAYQMENSQVLFCHTSLSAVLDNIADDDIVCHYATGTCVAGPHDGDLGDGDCNYCLWTQRESPWSYSSLRRTSTIFKNTSAHRVRLSRAKTTVPGIGNSQTN